MNEKVMKIHLNMVDDIKDFIVEATRYNGDATVVSGRHVVNAKSILGLLSLDLTQPVTLKIYGDNPEPMAKAVEKWAVA